MEYWLSKKSANKVNVCALPSPSCSSNIPSFQSSIIKGAKSRNFRTLLLIPIPLSLETRQSATYDKRHRRWTHYSAHDSLHTRTS